MREELKMVKRVDDVDPNMELSPELIAKFHKVSFQILNVKDAAILL